MTRCSSYAELMEHPGLPCTNNGITVTRLVYEASKRALLAASWTHSQEVWSIKLETASQHCLDMLNAWHFSFKPHLLYFSNEVAYKRFLKQFAVGVLSGSGWVRACVNSRDWYRHQLKVLQAGTIRKTVNCNFYCMQQYINRKHSVSSTQNRRLAPKSVSTTKSPEISILHLIFIWAPKMYILS